MEKGRCKYWDCGWCFLSDDTANKDKESRCLGADDCDDYEESEDEK